MRDLADVLNVSLSAEVLHNFPSGNPNCEYSAGARDSFECLADR
jgi:hypothetical protein